MKGNEVLLTLKNKGFEQGATNVLLRLAEEIEDINKALSEFAKAFDALVRVQTMLNGVVDGMDAKLKERMIKDDNPDSTRGMVG